VSQDEILIRAASLTKHFGDFIAVRDISFDIPRGQVAAFLGPNGAGKSTTMKMLTGFTTPTRGRAEIGGHDVARDRVRAAAMLGYLPENGPLYPDMTPLSLLRFFGEARGMAPDLIRRRIDHVVQLCALERVIEKPIAKLSRGYRQRVGMAHALLHDPPVLILDEPTAALDPNQIHQVRSLIRDLGRTKTVLLSTHILQEVEAVAQRVIFVHEGSLVFDGTIEAFRAGAKSLEEKFRNLTAA